MSRSTELRPRPPALPAKVDQFRALRQMKIKRNLNDLVEDLHLQLYEHDGYAKLLDAVYNEDAVEGSIIANYHEAAHMLREKATEEGEEDIAHVPLAKLKTMLGTVLRRYGCGRNQRLKLIGTTESGVGTHIIKNGKVVPIQGEDGE